MKIMPTNKFAAWLAAASVCLAGSLASGIVAAANAPAPALSQKLDNATCQTCHDGKKGKLEVPKADGEKRELHAVNTDKYGKSVHAKMECVACHKEIIDNVTPHQKVAGAPKVDCAQCHLDLWEAAKKDNKSRREAPPGHRRRKRRGLQEILPRQTEQGRADQAERHLQRLPQRAYLRCAAARHAGAQGLAPHRARYLRQMP
jgi:hypothetical protein